MNNYALALLPLGMNSAMAQQKPAILVIKSNMTDDLIPVGSGTTSSIYSLGGMYDLQGRFLHTFSLPGLYIADGKKISMK